MTELMSIVPRARWRQSGNPTHLRRKYQYRNDQIYIRAAKSMTARRTPVIKSGIEIRMSYISEGTSNLES